jgi:hypothetical protein
MMMKMAKMIELTNNWSHATTCDPFNRIEEQKKQQRTQKVHHQQHCLRSIFGDNGNGGFFGNTAKVITSQNSDVSLL